MSDQWGLSEKTLSDGRKITIDLRKITMREWRSLFDLSVSSDSDDQLFARVLGLTVDELVSLPQPLYREACKAVLDAGREPLKDPNSASVSTSA